ncbi:hypothetical protein BGZ96_009584 [Linnemannia gamsii]|uniref:Uncharacterized protein n=1 Tax=Linnemannia gamsii TaxID=64522 RepID=A0ABQ7JW48_9FUNG|nr:hypothetical protein BGZ96_009584 [Linnemannia gamsii]
MAFKNKNKDKSKDDDDNVQLMQHIPMAHLTMEDRPIYRVNSSCDDQGTPPYISMKDVYAALNYPGDILIYKDEFEESPVKIHKRSAGSSYEYQQSSQQAAHTQPIGDASPPAVANLEPVTSGIDGGTGGDGGGRDGSPELSVPAQSQAILPDHNMLTDLIADVGNLNDGTRLRVDRLRLKIDQMQQENWNLQHLNQDLQERNKILQQDIETFLQENESVKHENIALEHMNKERYEKGLAYRTEADGLRKTVQDLANENPRDGRPLPSLRSRLSQRQDQVPSARHQSRQAASHHQHFQVQHHQEQHHPHEQHHQGYHYYQEQRQQEQHGEGYYREVQLHHQEQRHYHEGYYRDERRHHQEQHHQGQHEQHRQRRSSKSAWDHWDTYGFDVVPFDNLPHDDHAWIMPARPDEEGGWITRTISMAARNRALKSELPFLPRAPKGQYTTSKTVESFLKIHRRTVEAVKDVQIYVGGADGPPSSSDISSTNADVGSTGRVSYVETSQPGGSPAYAIHIEHDDDDATGAAAATTVRAHTSQSRVSYKIDIGTQSGQGRDSSSEQDIMAHRCQTPVKSENDDFVAHGSRIEQLHAASAATAARADPFERDRADPCASSTRDRRVHGWVQQADDEEKDGDEL